MSCFSSRHSLLVPLFCTFPPAIFGIFDIIWFKKHAAEVRNYREASRSSVQKSCKIFFWTPLILHTKAEKNSKNSLLTKRLLFYYFHDVMKKEKHLQIRWPGYPETEADDFSSKTGFIWPSFAIFTHGISMMEISQAKQSKSTKSICSVINRTKYPFCVMK